jgi:hypothetical protein
VILYGQKTSTIADTLEERCNPSEKTDFGLFQPYVFVNDTEKYSFSP